MSDVKIIGFTGPKGSGKDAAADVLVRELGWVKINPGDPIRAMVRALLAQMGYDEVDIRDRVDGRNREAPVYHISGVDITPRHLMQTLGDDWGRGLIHPDLYACMMFTSARELLEAGVPGVAITGVRKPNEAVNIRMLGGEIWRVDRPGFEATGEHSSERGFEAIEADLTINNDGDLWSLNHALVPLFFRRNLAGVTDEMRARDEAARYMTAAECAEGHRLHWLNAPDPFLEAQEALLREARARFTLSTPASEATPQARPGAAPDGAPDGADAPEDK